MIRRRRHARETPFSLDSFLDLVTNIVGIIIRLILVAWVAGRAYTSLPEYLKKAPPPPPELADAKPEDDPLAAEIARQRRELAESESRMLEQLRQLNLVRDEKKQAEQELTSLDSNRRELDRIRAALEDSQGKAAQGVRQVAMSLDELEERRKRLQTELKELDKQPAPGKLLRYRTPVSQTVHAGESHFECRAGRVSHVDLEAFIAQVKRGMQDKEMQLRSDWQVSDVTEPVGAFQLRYVVERRKGDIDSLYPGGGPD